jgi:hypothetical protein
METCADSSYPSNEHCTGFVWLQGRPTGNTAVVSMRYRGTATRYLAIGVCCGLVIPVLGCHVTILVCVYICVCIACLQKKGGEAYKATCPHFRYEMMAN